MKKIKMINRMSNSRKLRLGKNRETVGNSIYQIYMKNETFTYWIRNLQHLQIGDDIE